MLLDYKHIQPKVEKTQLEDIIEPVQGPFKALDTYLASQEASFEPEIQELVRYCMLHSGKRLRPLLVFTAGIRTQGDEYDLVRAAAVVEMVHLATLVHDDILDDAAIRHRTRTVSRKYGNDVAVLLGDALFSQALKLAAEFPTPHICRAVAEATRRVCAGEIGQTFQRGNAEIKVTDYYRVIDLKTAELFRVSAYIGGFLSGHGEVFAEAAASFARHLGIAYQLYDDVTDVLGDEERLGKTLGTDLASGKYTLPLILLLEELDAVERVRFIHRLQEFPESTSELLEKLEQYDILTRVLAAFNSELNSADAVLEAYGDYEPTPHLLRLSHFLRQQISRYIDSSNLPTLA